MLIPEVCFQLKDGRDAVIRNPKEEDAEAMLQMLYTLAAETEFTIRYPEECDYTLEEERHILAQNNASAHQAMLICEVEGEIAGSCMVSVCTRIKTRHRASVAIGLVQKYWNQGIGTKMFQEMIRIAEGFSEVSQIELAFIEGNTRAQRLYEKQGFRIVGVYPNATRLKDGTLLHEYIMIKQLQR
ncbi:MAG: GNAT family N-acetyltransferase [Eubacteriales bacterium]|nr:GNAT family N-acetyltransferase [Eubacteriales bacterium]